MMLSVQPAMAGDDGAAEASAFLNTLSEAQRKEAIRPINDPERYDWTYFPGIRDGVSLGDLNTTQTKAFDAFLKATLSSQGLRRVDMLRKIEPVTDRGGGVHTGPNEYWVRFYGDPEKEAWAWRLEGHHLVLNAAIVGGNIVSVTPLFFGAAPVRGGSAAPPDAIGIEPLRAEDELAVALIRALNPVQTGVAKSIDSMPGDIRSGTERETKVPTSQGLAMSKMNPTQKAILKQIVEGYLDTWPKSAQSGIMKAFTESDPEKIHFAFSGSGQRAQPHYWRITAPTLIVEYWNGREGTNHAHAVLRTLHGEFASK